MRSVLDRDSEHLLPRPNVFMLALAVSPEWVPDVFGVFFLHRTWSTATRGDLTLLRKPPDYTHKPAPFNESDDSFKEKLHPFKPVEPISQRDAGKKKTKKTRLPSIYGKCKPQRQKWDMCKLLWMHSALCDECSMYNTGEGGVSLPTISLPFWLWKGGKKSKGCFIKGTWELLLPISNIQL